MKLDREGTLIVSGTITDLDVARAPLAASPLLLRSVQFRRASVEGVELHLDELQLSVLGSEFDGCSFVQRSRRLHRDGAEPQGSFGHRAGSTYRRCVFRGVRLRTLAGFSVGHALFEDCTFERCKFSGTFSHDADFVRCRFIGPVKGAVFSGTSPETGARNEFVDNDFTRAELDDVDFRNGIDLTRQSFPST